MPTYHHMFSLNFGVSGLSVDDASIEELGESDRQLVEDALEAAAAGGIGNLETGWADVIEEGED